MPTTVTTTSIKGGGRAELSEENENAIIDLLRAIRDPKDPLLPMPSKRNRAGDADDGSKAYDSKVESSKEPSDHEHKRERKRFVNRLVERHERMALARRINCPGTSVQRSTRSSTDGIRATGTSSTATTPLSADIQSLTLDAGDAADAAQAGDQATGKVRIILVEAVYSSKKKDKKEDSSKKRKNKERFAWKEGQTRKTIVLPRSTTAKELLKQVKSKLNMKKKPVRCFYVDSKTKLEMDLMTNLAGLEDGAIVYATSHVEAGNKDTHNGNDADTDAAADTAATDEEIELPDPLEPVKRAYAERKVRKARKKKRGNKNTADTEQGGLKILEHPTFADHFDKLEVLPRTRAELPAASYRTKVLTALDTSRVVIICGSTGCGKSTQIPQTILEGMSAAGRGNDTHVIVTQPRRVAAMSLAERVSSERNSPPPGSVGSVIGYSVRLSRKVSDDAKIVYCTVGVLLRMLINPLEVEDDELCPTESTYVDSDGKTSERRSTVPLHNVTHIVIDEVHERDLNTDFALTLLRPLLAKNSNIRVILMSATASPEVFVDYFRSSSVPSIVDPIVLSIPGRTFPVSINWLSECEKFAGTRLQGWTNNIDDGIRPGGSMTENIDDGAVALSPRATSRIDNAFICKLIATIVKKEREDGKLRVCKSEELRTDGAILVFLPGKGEIEALAKVLRDDPVVGNSNLCNVLKLHSTVSQAQQRYVFQRAKVGTVKIVLSTNVSETSVTIPDVSSVIDTGRVKESRFNPETRIKELVTVWTSRASATQRQGRAGRTGPGMCWKLYTEQFCNDQLPMRTPPEIFRTPLDELVLQCCLLEENAKVRDQSTSSRTILSGTMPIKFLRQAPEPPPTKSLLHACEHLLEVGALEFVASEPEYVFRLTPLGYHLAHLPMDAKVAKCLIIGCVLECVEPSLTIAACLSHSKSIWLPSRCIDKDAREMQKKLVEEGFGGKGWKGGTVKGDLIGAIAAYEKWSAHPKEKDRRKVASQYALDHNVLREVHGLRKQFKDSLVDAAFLENNSGWDSSHDDALFTSCCLVAGLYPNFATLMRPRKGRGNLRGGRLITKDGDVCKASSSSFQCDRLWNANETGRDAYAVFHAKHRSIGVDTQSVGGGQADIYLNEVNFVSRFALLLFSGEVELRGNAIILDGWLKFKIGDRGKAGAILIIELRKELDNVMTRHIQSGDGVDEGPNPDCQRVLRIVRKLLQDEAG